MHALEEYAATLARRRDYSEQELRNFLTSQDYGGMDQACPVEFEQFIKHFIEIFQQKRAEAATMELAAEVSVHSKCQ